MIESLNAPQTLAEKYHQHFPFPAYVNQKNENTEIFTQTLIYYKVSEHIIPSLKIMKIKQLVWHFRPQSVIVSLTVLF